MGHPLLTVILFYLQNLTLVLLLAIHLLALTLNVIVSVVNQRPLLVLVSPTTMISSMTLLVLKWNPAALIVLKTVILSINSTTHHHQVLSDWRSLLVVINSSLHQLQPFCLLFGTHPYHHLFLRSNHISFWASTCWRFGFLFWLTW